MTATLPHAAAKKQTEQSAEAQAAAELVRQAKEQGLSLTGPDGLLKQLTNTVPETSFKQQMTQQLGYEKQDPAGAGAAQEPNGTKAKTVLTEHSGPAETDVPPGTSPNRITDQRQTIRWHTTIQPDPAQDTCCGAMGKSTGRQGSAAAYPA